MLNEALFIHYQITARVFTDAMKLSVFYLIGWIAPLIFVLPLSYLTFAHSEAIKSSAEAYALNGDITLTEFADTLIVYSCFYQQENPYLG